MLIENIRQFVKEKAKQFGATTEGEFNKSYVERNNTGPEALKDDGAYFGLIQPEEEASGPYHDFSLVIFPTSQNKPWLVCLGVGSSGFKNDYELATYPGVRRLFSTLIDEKGFCKSDLSDIETSLPKAIVGSPDLQHLKNTIKRYSKFLPVCRIVNDPGSEQGMKVIAAFVAAYAKLRDWPTNSEHRKSLSEALLPFMTKKEIDDASTIVSLLKERKYIVLQGPPGTGKTRMAKHVTASLNAKTFFTQFHAETSYADFIYGIRPDIASADVKYKEYVGVFTLAVKYAQNNPKENVVLIIDEVNRANLSNVLGPIFYLFEHKMDDTDVEIEIYPSYKLKKLPANFYTIATMNTADRSLAVVDFALKRRFAWYSLQPTPLPIKEFFKEDFSSMQEIFNWYASDNELSLQPGQGYFIASSEEEMLNRLKYELLPLIKEYIQEGLLKTAKEEFNNYFLSRINQSL